MAAFYATHLAAGAIVRLKVVPTLRVIINIFYFLPSLFYLVSLYALSEVPIPSLRAAEITELTCIIGLHGSCWMTMRLEDIIDRLSPILLLALW
jgi:hypothetical protein